MSGGASTIGGPERVVARMRRSARILVLPGILLVAVAFGVGYYGVVGPLPPQFRPAIWVLAGLLLVFGVLWPFGRWLSATSTLTTKRVVSRSGLVPRRRLELELDEVVDVAVRRGPLQFLAGSGDVRVGAEDRTLVLRDLPKPAAVQSAVLSLVSDVGMGPADRVT
ncbi:PH domain-containing protein [Agromyces seonyuensis]|uniref:PH domain-containing protein n=1 Tax=Agromyces seonyuensis TaxID=2662446 RepID=A0A6I4P2M4_9MICO|nr:PH domain-containing protein [Agromyces seonyuensis]MWB99872.1 PH domain-containing protein [Agromyces seonyuensis]